MGLFGCQQNSEGGNDTDGNNSKQDDEIENVQKEGYILKVEEGSILVAENITSEKYEEIQDKMYLASKKCIKRHSKMLLANNPLFNFELMTLSFGYSDL